MTKTKRKRNLDLRNIIENVPIFAGYYKRLKEAGLPEITAASLTKNLHEIYWTRELNELVDDNDGA